MHPIFQINSADVRALNDETARELIARLCKATLTQKGIGTDTVTWGGDQRAKDGGVDVRVDSDPTTAPGRYIPKGATAFQVKAEVFGKSKIPGEMAPHGKLRPAIIELGKIDGAYVIVSTRDNLSDSSLIDRRKTMNTCLATYGLSGKLHLDFYDSRKVADWVENFPQIVTWMRQELGKPLVGWRPYGPWAYYETDLLSEYLVDDKIKIFSPSSDDGLPVSKALDKIRGELVEKKAAVRIVGLSGVGKTRLVQALFDSRILTSNSALDKENVIYADLADDLTPQPIAMLDALCSDGADTVVVIDNCGQDTHQKLTEIVKRPNSALRLITIEYDIRDDLPEGTNCYRLEGSSDEVIGELLARRFDTLSGPDVEKIVEFSDGNARVAFALASTSDAKGDIAQLTDDSLFRRLFIQKSGVSDELWRCAEAGSLVYSFDVVDFSPTSEIARLASVSEVSSQAFFRNISELQRRGLVQQRGNWKAILPHAIANKLAARAFDSSPSSLLVQKFVIEAPDRVARSFSRRMGFLHTSTQVQQIANDWLKVGGLLSDVSKLDELHKDILKNIAPINQRAAIDAISRAVDAGETVSLNQQARDNIAHMLRSLAYEPELFEQASMALVTMTIEDIHESNIADLLTSLFYSHLSGTMAPPEMRARFVIALAESGDANKQRIAILLLRAALEANHFSSNYNFDFGARRRSYGWHPKTVEEMHDWYGRFISIAVDIGKAATTTGADSRALLGVALRGLWGDAYLRQQLVKVADDLLKIDGWLDGWIGVRNTWMLDKKGLQEDALKELEALEKKLAPKDLAGKIQAKVLSRGNFSADLEDDIVPLRGLEAHQRALEEATSLGSAAAMEDGILDDLRPFISEKNDHGKLWNFGVGVGMSASSVHGILERLRVLVESRDPSNVNIQFTCGLLSGWNKQDAGAVSSFLDIAVTDETWSFFLPELQLYSVELDSAGARRLLGAMDVGVAPTWKFRNLSLGKRTASLSIQELDSLLTALAKKTDRGLETAADILNMAVFGAKDRDEQHQLELRSLCVKFIDKNDWGKFDFSGTNDVGHLGAIISYVLEDGNFLNEAALVISGFIRRTLFAKQRLINYLGDILSPFFSKCPKQALDSIYIADSDGGFKSAFRIVAALHSRFNQTAAAVVPGRDLIEWCQISPSDRCTFAAQICGLLEPIEPDAVEDESAVRISSAARELLEFSPNREQVLNIFIRRIYPVSWSGPLSTLLRRRAALLDELNPNGDLKTHQLLAKAKDQMGERIKDEETREAAEERSRSSRFEY